MSALTHTVAPEEVMAFLDHELSTDGAQSVSKHISECAECQRVRDTLGSVAQSLAKWAVPAVSSHLEENVRRSAIVVQNSSDRNFLERLQGLPRRRPFLACAGALLAALLIFVGLSSTRYDRMVSNAPRAHGGGQKEAEYQRALEKLEQKAPQSPSAGADRYSVDLAESGRNSMGALLGGVPGASSVNGPMIARTVSLSMVVKDFDAGRASLDAILSRHNGYAANLSVSTPQDTARVIQASLRIPAPQLAQALSELKALGRVENENQNGEEVTQQHADLVARLKNSRETEQRLQDVLRTRTGKVKDVLEVEEEIARVRGEIERMEAEQKTLEHRVDFATIDLKLAEEYKAQLNTPAPSVLMQLRNATINGFRNAFEGLLSLALFLAESGPSLLLWLALLGVPAWRLWRRYRRAQTLGSLAGA